jgi:mono/diheme cytochrome c family protein
MSPKVRWLLLGIAALALAAAWIDRSGLLRPPPAPIVVTPELVAAGRKVYRNRCHTCHTDIPLGRRVKDWAPMHAYEVIGRLQGIGVSPERKPMPPFPGTDDERRALAAWISELGAGRVPQY